MNVRAWIVTGVAMLVWSSPLVAATVGRVEQREGETYFVLGNEWFRQMMKQAQRYDPGRADPLRWSIADVTQSVLTNVRQMLYATDMLHDAQQVKPGAGAGR